MALLGFFHVNSLFCLPVHSHKTWIHRPTGIVRKRSHMVGKEDEGRRKKPRKKHFTVTGIWTLRPCLQSRACYPLSHGTLPAYTGLLTWIWLFLHCKPPRDASIKSESTICREAIKLERKHPRVEALEPSLQFVKARALSVCKLLRSCAFEAGSSRSARWNIVW